MPLTPATTDKLMKVGLPGSATTLSAPGYTTGVSNSMTVPSTTNWPTDTKVIYAVDRAQVVNGVETRIAGTYNEFEGIVTGANTVSNVVLRYGTAQNYPAGSLTRVYIPVSSTRENDLIDALRVAHDGTGKLIPAAVQEALNIGAVPADFVPLATPPSTVVYNGQRSYTLTIPGQDYTTSLSPGKRLRTVRTVAAPTQSTSLNGTTQYWSKTSPTIVSAITGDHTIVGWFKLTAYPPSGNATIFAMTSGATGGASDKGLGLRITSTGQPNAFYGNAGYVTSNAYQSVPLNKWVHAAVVVQPSTKTFTYYLDGIAIPSAASTGTATSVLNTGTTIYVGAANFGSVAEFLNGKIAQTGVIPSALTATQMRNICSQGLTSANISTGSAYSFDGTGNDINTTNANNLSAFNGAVATATDSPFGTQGSGLISSTVDYAIIQSVTYAPTSTTINCQVPEGCTIPTSGGVASMSYSGDRAPYGFPASRAKWRIETIKQADELSNALAANIWTASNHKLAVPIGDWTLGYEGSFGQSNSVAGVSVFRISLGVATGEVDWVIKAASTATQSDFQVGMSRSSQVQLTAAQVYTQYMLQQSGGGTVTIGILASPVGNVLGRSSIYADNALL